MTVSVDTLIELLETEFPRVERWSDEMFAAGDRDNSVVLEGWIVGDWLRLHAIVAPVEAFSDHELVELLRANFAPSRWRFSTDGSQLLMRIDYPLHLYGADGVLGVVRAMHATVVEFHAHRKAEQ